MGERDRKKNNNNRWQPLLRAHISGLRLDFDDSVGANLLSFVSHVWLMFVCWVIIAVNIISLEACFAQRKAVHSGTCSVT